jgi:hypothetical protein
VWRHWPAFTALLLRRGVAGPAAWQDGEISEYAAALGLARPEHRQPPAVAQHLRRLDRSHRWSTQCQACPAITASNTRPAGSQVSNAATSTSSPLHQRRWIAGAGPVVAAAVCTERLRRLPVPMQPGLVLAGRRVAPTYTNDRLPNALVAARLRSAKKQQSAQTRKLCADQRHQSPYARAAHSGGSARLSGTLQSSRLKSPAARGARRTPLALFRPFCWRPRADET